MHINYVNLINVILLHIFKILFQFLILIHVLLLILIQNHIMLILIILILLDHIQQIFQ